jgi:hypothetical protein
MEASNDTLVVPLLITERVSLLPMPHGSAIPNIEIVQTNTYKL